MWSVQRQSLNFIILILISCSFFGCGGSGSDSPSSTPRPTSPVSPENQAPVVDAGNDLNIDAGSSVQMAATASDSDGSITGIEWSQLQGSTATISSVDSLTPNITVPLLQEEEILIFRVEVVDDDGAINSDDISIRVSPLNGMPMAEAGNNFEVTAGVSFTLDGSASDDVDGQIQTYEWLLDNQVVSNDVRYQTSLSTVGTYVYTLRVTDDDGAAGQDQVTVTIRQANEFSVSFSMNILQQNPQATARSCGDFTFDRTRLRSALLTRARFSDQLDRRQRERDEIAEDKQRLQNEIARLDEEITASSQTLQQQQSALEDLEQLTENAQTEYRDCIALNGRENCVNERNLLVNARDDEDDQRDRVRVTQAELDLAESNRSSSQRSLDDVTSDEADNQQFFLDYENSERAFDEAAETLLTYIDRDAVRYVGELDGEIIETTDNKIFHARALFASPDMSIGLYQAPGLLSFLHNHLHPVGGISTFEWDNLWATNAEGIPNASTQIQALLSSNDEIRFSIDYPTYCLAGFDSQDVTQFNLDEMQLEIFVSERLSLQNDYQVDINLVETFNALKEQANSYGFIRSTAVEQLFSSSLPGFSITVTSVIDQDEFSSVEQQVKRDYLNRVLATLGVPSIKAELSSDCNTQSSNWCQYHGWWLRDNGSPISPGENILGEVDQYTLTGETLVRDYLIVPVN